MTQTIDLPQIERLNNGQPILRKVPDHPWENKVVFNPAVVLVDDVPTLERSVAALPVDARTKNRLRSHEALCFLYYRAQGSPTPIHDYRRSTLGLAVLTPALEVLVRLGAPLIKPEYPYENLGIEDPRITRIGDQFYLFYAAYASGMDHNRIRIALASSRDLVHWEKHGLLKGSLNSIDNKNGMLFPALIGGRYMVLHRPMEGPDALSIHVATSDDLLGEWKSSGVVMKPIPNSEFKDVWIGGGAPPLSLPGDKWLLLYHIGNRKADGQREYDLGLAIADPTSREFIVHRAEPLLRPTSGPETQGDADLGVNNVVFVCGAYFYRGNLYFPYNGSDSVVLGARIVKEELNRYLHAIAVDVR